MSARPTRLTLSTGAAALALGLLSPTAALADSGHGHGNGSGDPAGNNGTIKIDPYGVTDGNANHPHPGCDFRLQLFGFDAGQTGTITFSGQAPTRDAVTTQPLPGTQQLSDDAAGGGQDRDAHFDIRGAQLGLSGTPQAQQGFHIRVEVNADGAPGGAKTKVFWLSCPGAAGTSTAGSTGSAGSTQTAGSDSGATTEQAGSTAPAGGTTSTTSSAGSTGTVSTLSQGVTSGAATSAATGEAATGEVQAAGATAGSTVAGPSTYTGGSAAAVRSTGRTGAPAARGLALPFTGLPVAGLIGLGLGTAALGGLAIAAGRRRTSVLDRP